MKKTGLSIIIPFAGEYPQVLFTIQATAQMLLPTKVPFEIIAVDNHCGMLAGQAEDIASGCAKNLERKLIDDAEDLTAEDMFEVHNKVPPVYENRSGAAIQASAKGNEWLKYLKYDRRLSHWRAKRVGVEESEYDTLLFMDAHVVPTPAVADMFMHYRFKKTYGDNGKFYFDLGTMHMPLTYKILEWHRLVYKLVIQNEYFYTYSFTPLRNTKEVFEVPCMSTCGMMIGRHIYDRIGGWPEGLGVYGGGENFMNYTLAVCGFKKFIYPFTTLFHHGDRRDYHYYGDDMIGNRMIAHYLFGGEELLSNFVRIAKGRQTTLQQIARRVKAQHEQHRGIIKNEQKISIEEWAKQWT